MTSRQIDKRGCQKASKTKIMNLEPMHILNDMAFPQLGHLPVRPLAYACNLLILHHISGMVMLLNNFSYLETISQLRVECGCIRQIHIYVMFLAPLRAQMCHVIQRCST